MQDADIHEIDIGDGNSLFAVFDGHGGTSSLTKDPKSVNTWLQCSQASLKT